MLKGVAGFGADHHTFSSSIVDISDRMPLKIEFIESREKVDELLGKLEELAGTGLIEMQETTVAKPAQLSKQKQVENGYPPPHLKIEGKAKLMRIYVGESDRWKDKPLYKALVEAMRANDIAGVTVYRGILGYGAHSRAHNNKPLSRDASIMLTVVDTEDNCAFLPLVEQMVEEGLIVLSDVASSSTRIALYRSIHCGLQPERKRLLRKGNSHEHGRCSHERAISSPHVAHPLWRERQVAWQAAA